MNLPDDLLKLIRHGENYQIEYKEAKNELPRSIYETVSSFSNREGGDIFLGVNDCGVITGCDETSVPQMISTFGTTIKNPDKINPALYLTAQEYTYISDGSFTGKAKNGTEIKEKSGIYTIIHIHVPVSGSVIRNSGKIYDRNGDADIDITNFSDLVFQCYARKQNRYFVNQVFPFWSVKDLRKDLIDKARKMAVTRQQIFEGKNHPWAESDDEMLLRSANLILTDEKGQSGITLAAVLLFGKDNMIASACAHHKTDCIYRVHNLDRYDDREVITTNLLDSYEQMFEFGQKHLNDLFVLDGILNISARDKILREIISNSLAHRDYSNPYIAKMIIEENQIVMENGNRAHGLGPLDVENFAPFPKNPAISKVFREIGYADELGSGMRNSYKFTRLYSGANPEFIEGDVFKTIIPLSISAKTIASGQAGGQASGQADTQVSMQAGTQDSGQVDGQPLTISLDVTRLNQLLDYCSTPRTREEMQQFCGIKSRDYLRTKILVPLISLKKIFSLIPDKPNSPKQKYCSNKNYSSLENPND